MTAGTAPGSGVGPTTYGVAPKTGSSAAPIERPATPMSDTLPPHRAPRIGYRAFVPALVIGLVIGLVLVVALPPTSPDGAGPGRWTDANVWSNGQVVVAMTPDRPAMTVSNSAVGTSYGLYAGVSVVSEITPAGVAVASTDLDRASWTVTNSSGSGLDLSYRSSASVVDAVTLSPIGSTEVFVNFSSTPDAGVDPAASAQVGFGLVVLHWPWVHTNDRLAIDMPLWPQDTSVADLSVAPGVANKVHCLTREGPSPAESFTWEPNASARTGSQTHQPLQAVTHLVGDAAFMTVQVVFVGPGGGYDALEYDPQIVVPVAAIPVSLPPVDYAAAGVLALVGIGVVVVGVRHTWNRPPSLERVE